MICKTCNAKINKRNKSGYCHKCYCWKGGIAESPYPREFNDSLREQIRFRDKYKCQECGTPQVECLTKLSVHHIDYNKSNNAHSNLISLCQHCHTSISHNRDKWESHFKEKINAYDQDLARGV